MIIKKILFISLLTISSQFLIAQCWNLVWEDEFDGTALNQDYWSYQTGNSGWGNNELQYYRDGNNNVTLSGGSLQITAKEESYMGADYTSARIRTSNKVDWTHGKMEARMKLPEGQGIWPACWMLPTDNVFGGWPHSGEIDIMEYLGHETDKAYGTIHYSINNAHNYDGDSYTLASGGFNDAFHTFTVEWESGAVRWYIDDVLFHSVTETSLGIDPWVFDEDFHFIVNLAVGGNWPGNPDGTTVFPQTLEVDYLRVYQQLSEVTMDGDDYVQPGDTNKKYSLPAIAGASYLWTVPTGAAITAGQGTEEITVTWGSTSGNVSCDLSTSCGTETVIIPVTVNPNFFENPAFEEDYINWNQNNNNGATADFTITSSNTQEGSKSAQVVVTNTGSNPWDIQLQRSGITLEAGVEYQLNFWGKSETAGLVFPVAFVEDQSPYTLYGNTNFTSALNWTPYSYTFTPTVTDDVLFNIDLGSNAATFYFDNFTFEETTPLPVELGSFSLKQTGPVAVLLEWTTLSELNNDYFEIYRAVANGSFKNIGKVTGNGTRASAVHYQFSDEEASPGLNYYQLHQIDYDGQRTRSDIQVLNIANQRELQIFPNPVDSELNIPSAKDGERIKIYDTLGTLALEFIFMEGESQLFVGHLQPGLYVLTSGDAVYKFIKR